MPIAPIALGWLALIFFVICLCRAAARADDAVQPSGAADEPLPAAERLPQTAADGRALESLAGVYRGSVDAPRVAHGARSRRARWTIAS